MAHPPRIPVWLRWDQPVIYFVTICVAGRQPVLANEYAFVAFKNAAARLRDWTVLAAVLMPDHLHAIVAPINDREAKLGNCSAAIKRWMRQELKASWKWQPGCFDRLLRSGESLHDKWLYVEENPVRAGFVQRWEDWPYRYEFNESKQGIQVRGHESRTGLPRSGCRATASVAVPSGGKRSACPTIRFNPPRR